MTGFAQRAGAAMFQASRETTSGVASRRPLMLPPLVTLRHRNDVEGWAVQDHVGAFARGIDIHAEAVERGKAGVGESRTHHAVPGCGAAACADVVVACSGSYSPASSLRRKSFPTGDFG